MSLLFRGEISWISLVFSWTISGSRHDGALDVPVGSTKWTSRGAACGRRGRLHELDDFLANLGAQAVFVHDVVGLKLLQVVHF